MSSDDLIVDPNRGEPDGHITGIFIRARNGDKWGSFDIAVLTRESVLRWLAGRDERYLKSTILALLGHPHVIDE